MPIRLTTIAAAAFCAVLPLTAMAQATDSSGASAPAPAATTHKHSTKHTTHHHKSTTPTQPASDTSAPAK